MRDKLLVVAHLTANPDSELVGKRIREIGAEHQVFFLALARDGTETHYPTADTVFQSGDGLTVQTEPQTLKLLHKWNRDLEPY